MAKQRTVEKYMGPEENEREILSRMPEDLRAEYDSFGNRRIEAAFQDRVFVLYQATGRGNNQIHRAPRVITTIRVISFVARDDGATIRLLDEAANRTLEIGHVPVKLFEYPIFVSIPLSFTYRWDAHVHGGGVERTANYLMFVKSKNRADFMNKDNYYLETVNRLRELYAHLDLKLDL